MKYLSDYMEKAQTDCFNKHGAFFAFSDKQFEEQKKDGVKYTSMGMGMICPKDNAKKLYDELDEIYRTSIQQDMKENGKDKVIQRELINHECYYVGSPQGAIEALSDYPITKDEIIEVYNREYEDYIEKCM